MPAFHDEVMASLEVLADNLLTLARHAGLRGHHPLLVFGGSAHALLGLEHRPSDIDIFLPEGSALHGLLNARALTARNAAAGAPLAEVDLSTCPALNGQLDFHDLPCPLDREVLRREGGGVSLGVHALAAENLMLQTICEPGPHGTRLLYALRERIHPEALRTRAAAVFAGAGAEQCSLHAPEVIAEALALYCEDERSYLAEMGAWLKALPLPAAERDSFQEMYALAESATRAALPERGRERASAPALEAEGPGL